MRIEAVLFDAAGTLIELRESVGTSYARFARQQGALIRPGALEDAFTRTLRDSPPRVFPGLSPEAAAVAERAWWHALVRSTFRLAASEPTPTTPDDLVDTLFDDLYDFYWGQGAWQLRPYAAEALAALAADGRRLGVVSNFDHRLPDILQALEIERFMEIIMIPASCGFAKPDPAFFDLSVKALGLSPAWVLYLGDDPEHDVLAARAAGLRAACVSAPDALRSLAAHIDTLATLGDLSDNERAAAQKELPR